MKKGYSFFLKKNKIYRLHLWHYGRMLTSILFGGILTFLPYINPSKSII